MRLAEDREFGGTLDVPLPSTSGQLCYYCATDPDPRYMFVDELDPGKHRLPRARRHRCTSVKDFVEGVEHAYIVRDACECKCACAFQQVYVRVIPRRSQREAV